jgi:hypothetical protein
MPQPVDLQTELARTSAVERIQQVADRLSLAGQQRSAVEAQRERLEQEQQVQQPPETGNRPIEPDGRRRNPYVGRRRRRKKGDKKTVATLYNAHEEPELLDGEGDQFDVSV